MQTDEPQQFRLNTQVLILVAVALMALAAPLAMVIFSLRSMSGRGAEPTNSPPEAAAPLEKALEDIAGRTLAPAGLLDDQPRLEIRTDRPDEVLARVEALLKSYDASALPPERGEGTIRVVVMLPASRVADFFAASQAGDSGDRPEVPLTRTLVVDETRTLVEIVIQKKTDP